MPVPEPHPHPTPTPTPRPVQSGFVTAGDYLSAECEYFKSNNDLGDAMTKGEVLEYLEKNRDIIIASEL